MMTAIGHPGQLPRLWVEGTTDLVRAQMLDGEIAVTDVVLDEKGRPISTTLPGASA